MNNWPEEQQIESLLVVHNVENANYPDLDMIEVPPGNDIFSQIRNSMLAKKWCLREKVGELAFCKSMEESVAVTVPLHTPYGRHFGLFLVCEEAKLHRHELQQIKHFGEYIFERFNQEVIVPMTLPIISPRELEVIRWSAEGKTSVEIAVILGLSEHTINSYTTKILQKLQVVNRAQMVGKAIRMGLIQ